MKPYYEEPNAVIYQGHSLDILRELPAESVDCAITSPPYWGLRTYKTEPIVWDDNHCEHEWGAESLTQFNPQQDCAGGLTTKIIGRGNQGFTRGTSGVASQGNFCLKCGAWKGELGLEPTIELYVSHLLQVFDEVKRVLKKTGTLWVNMGDSYYGGGFGHEKDLTAEEFARKYPKQGSNKGTKMDWEERKMVGDTKRGNLLPAKCLCLIPERFALGMVERGWILRNNIIWYKSNPMPESCKDRFTGTYEYLYFFVKNKKYWFEQQFEKSIWAEHDKRFLTGPSSGGKATSGEYAINRAGVFREDGNRNKRDVWEINTQPYPDAHFAVFPEKLVEIPILSGCPQDGVVMDIFAGSGTTGAVAKRLSRKYIGIELSEKYCKLHKKRLQAVPLPMELI